MELQQRRVKSADLDEPEDAFYKSQNLTWDAGSLNQSIKQI